MSVSAYFKNTLEISLRLLLWLDGRVMHFFRPGDVGSETPGRPNLAQWRNRI